MTDNHSLVLTEDSLGLLTPQDMYNHILRLTKERDNMYLNWISSICVERDTSACEESASNVTILATSGLTSNPVSLSSNTESNHMAVELADLKSKLRKLRQEL